MKLIGNRKEMIMYCVFGTTAAIINIFFLHIFNLLIGEEFFLINNVLSWIITVAFAFTANKLWVFNSKSWEKHLLLKELGGFVGARLISLAIEEFGLTLFITILHFDVISIKIFPYDSTGILLSKIILQIIVIISNYVFSKLIIFRDRDKSKNKKE